MSEEKKETELKDEQLEAVTGGCEPKDSGDHSTVPRWVDAGYAQWYVPSGITEGAKILQESGWTPPTGQQIPKPEIGQNVPAPEPPVPKP